MCVTLLPHCGYLLKALYQTASNQKDALVLSTILWYLDRDLLLDGDSPLDEFGAEYFSKLVHNTPKADVIIEQIRKGHCFKMTWGSPSKLILMSVAD